jgi:hypothetical protein
MPLNKIALARTYDELVQNDRYIDSNDLASRFWASRERLIAFCPPSTCLLPNARLRTATLLGYVRLAIR